MEELSHRKRSRVDSAESLPEFDSDPTKVKRIREDLLSLLEDSDTVTERDPASHDLDSVIRSFEEEISGSGSSSPAPNPVGLIDLTSDSGETRSETGGLGGELNPVESGSSGIEELWEFQEGLTSYDPFGFGLGYENNIRGDVENQGNEYVTLDGIFDYGDVDFGSDFTWRPETLPAL